jgi:hypothetical protein
MSCKFEAKAREFYASQAHVARHLPWTHALDASVGSVGDVLLGFRLRLSLPLDQSQSGCQKQRRLPRRRFGMEACLFSRSDAVA